MDSLGTEALVQQELAEKARMALNMSQVGRRHRENEGT